MSKLFWIIWQYDTCFLYYSKSKKIYNLLLSQKEFILKKEYYLVWQKLTKSRCLKVIKKRFVFCGKCDVWHKKIEDHSTINTTELWSKFPHIDKLYCIIPYVHRYYINIRKIHETKNIIFFCKKYVKKDKKLVVSYWNNIKIVYFLMCKRLIFIKHDVLVRIIFEIHYKPFRYALHIFLFVNLNWRKKVKRKKHLCNKNWVASLSSVWWINCWVSKLFPL